MVLLTDGVNNRGSIDPRTAAKAAAAFGISIYAIGVGTEGMAPVPVGRGVFGLRYENRPVEIDDALLTDVASARAAAISARAMRRRCSASPRRSTRSSAPRSAAARTSLRGAVPLAAFGDADRRRGRAVARRVEGATAMNPQLLLDAVEMPWLLVLSLVLPVLFYFAAPACAPDACAATRAARHPDRRARLVPPNVLALEPAGARRGSALAALLRRHRHRGARGGGSSARWSDGDAASIMVLAVDASLSMMATDERPNRLETREAGDPAASRRVAERPVGCSRSPDAATCSRRSRSTTARSICSSTTSTRRWSDRRAARSRVTIAQGTDLLAATKSGGDRALVDHQRWRGIRAGGGRDGGASARRAKGRAQPRAVGLRHDARLHDPDPRGQPRHREARSRQGRSSSRSIIRSCCGPRPTEPPARSSMPPESNDKAAKIRRALVQLRAGRSAPLEAGVTRTPRFQCSSSACGAPPALDTCSASVEGGDGAPSPLRRPRQRHRYCSPFSRVRQLAAGRGRERGVRAKDYGRAANSSPKRSARATGRPARSTTTAPRSSPPIRWPPAAEVLERSVERAEPRGALSRPLQQGFTISCGTRAPSDSGGAGRSPPRQGRTERFCERAAEAALADVQARADPAADGPRREVELRARAARRRSQGGGGGGGGGAVQRLGGARQERAQAEPTLAQRQAEQLLGSAEREERDVQSKKQKQNRPEPPPGGKDW